MISIQDVNLHVQTYNIQNIRQSNKYSLAEFNYNLSFVTWEDISYANDVGSMFNYFLNIFQGFFILVFQKLKKSAIIMSNRWTTLSIRTSCCFKRDHLITKNYNYPKLKIITKHIAKHCQTLLKRKKSHYNRSLIPKIKLKVPGILQR